jgi:hypothetical protein
MNNPYESPSSNLSSGKLNLTIPIDLRQSLIVAWSVLVVLSFLQIFPTMGNYANDIFYVSLISMSVTNAVAVLSVFYIRGPFVVVKGELLKSSYLSWFGFAWRAYVSTLLAIFPFAIFAFLFIGAGDKFTVSRIISSNIVQSFSVVFIVWVFFSFDRIGQVKKLVALARGW